MARHEIELALNSRSYRRVQKGLEGLFGREFWRRSSREANKAMRDYLREVHKVGDRAARDISKEFSKQFDGAAKDFSSGMRKAAEDSSAAYHKAMRRSLDRIARIQAANDRDRQAAVQKIIQEELKAADERLKAEKRIARERERAAEKERRRTDGGGPRPGRPGGGGGRHGERAREVGGKLTDLGGKLGGRAGKALGALGGFAAQAGPIIAAAAAMGVLAKKAVEITNAVNQMNKSMMQGSGAADIFATGAVDVAQGIHTVRRAFTQNIFAMAELKLTAEEATGILNAYSAAGLRVADVQRDLGVSTQTAAFEMAKTAQVYGTLLGVESSAIAEHIGKVTQELGYSFDAAIEGLATIDMYAQKSGMSVGVFFARVQSLNAQLGLMNASLKAQAKLVADASDNATFGVEGATEAIGQLMSTMDFDTALKAVTVASSDTRKVIQTQLETVRSLLQSDDLDEGARKRMQALEREMVQALRSGTKEMANLLTSGLTDGVSEMGIRMGVVADVLGKSLNSLSADDLRQSLTAEQVIMIQELGGFGSEQDVYKGLYTMADILDKNGTALDAIAALQEETLNQNLDEEIAEDIRIAQDQLRVTEDTTKILTNIKDLLYEQIYSVMMGMYELLVIGFGQDREKLVLQFDKALRRADMDVQNAVRNGSSQEEIDRLTGIRDAVYQERTTLGQMNEAQVQDYIDTYGAGRKDLAVQRRIGSGYATGGAGGELTGGSSGTGGVSGSPHVAMSAEERERLAAEQARQRQIQLASARAQNEVAKAILQEEGMTAAQIREIISAEHGSGAWAALARENPAVKGQDASMALLYLMSQGMVDVNSVRARMAAAATGTPQLADGGIVSRPTMALIGESGPEAVVPLGRGGMGEFHFHVHGNVYGMDEMRQMMKQALMSYDRSRRV